MHLTAGLAQDLRPAPIRRCAVRLQIKTPAMAYACLALLDCAWGQPEEAAQEPTIRVDINLIVLQAAVLDRSGHPVPGLGRQAFRLFVDGRPRAITLFQAAMAVPGQVVPNDPAIEQAVLNGEKVFDTIGCSSCHIPKLALRDNGWIFTEPNPYNPSTNLRVGTTKTVSVDLNSADQYDQDSLIEFLKTLQVLPPGTPYLVVDENFREKKWSLSSQLNSRTVEKK